MSAVSVSAVTGQSLEREPWDNGDFRKTPLANLTRSLDRRVSLKYEHFGFLAAALTRGGPRALHQVRLGAMTSSRAMRSGCQEARERWFRV